MAPWYTGLADLTGVLWWAFLWLGWFLLLGMVCASACWYCRRTGVDFWLQAGPPGPDAGNGSCEQRPPGDRTDRGLVEDHLVHPELLETGCVPGGSSNLEVGSGDGDLPTIGRPWKPDGGHHARKQ